MNSFVNSDSKMFSVVIPLYNKAHTIVKTITSVLTQTYTDFELIIVDDGSTDNSVALIKNTFNDCRIKLVCKTNEGVSATRNRGIIESSGDYICFLDADDEWLPHYLETIEMSIRDNTYIDMIHVPAFHRDVVNGWGSFWVAQKYVNKTCQIDVFESAYRLCAQTSGVTIRRSIIMRYMNEHDGVFFPDDMTYEEDMTCFYSIALNSNVFYIGKPLSIRNYNVRGQLVSIKRKQVLLDSQVKYLNYLYANYISIGKTNKGFESFFRYELRTRICSAIRNEMFDFFCTNININVIKNISEIEWKIYCSSISPKFKCYVSKLLRLKQHIKRNSVQFV